MSHRILIVEDNTANAHLLRAMIETAGLEAVIVGSGEDAVGEASTLAYSLIVMDITLPGISGIEAARRIRMTSDDRVSEIPIIALTAIGDFVRDDCQAVEMSAVFLKPQDISKVVPAIIQTLKEQNKSAA